MIGITIEQLPASHGSLPTEDFDRIRSLVEAAGLEAVIVWTWYGGGDDSYKTRGHIIHRTWSFGWEPYGQGVFGQQRRTLYACEPVLEVPDCPPPEPPMLFPRR